jgi:hypothetical protein
MAKEISNYERLIALANSVFETKNDPHQLDVNEEVMERLVAIHPSCLSEFDEGDGPISWVLVFPTSNILRDRFLKNEITEKELFYLTEIGIKYDAIYLCSALVLEEHRKKGIAKQLTLNAIKNIQKDHKITSLFYWAFTEEGRWAAESVAKEIGLDLLEKKG